MGRHNRYDFGSEGDVSMCVYKIQNKLNGLVYIGKTTVKALRRWANHLTTAKSSTTHIGRSLNKYGKDAFTFEVIDIAENELSLSSKESFYISYYNSLSPNGYNLTTGGEGSTLSEETKEKLSFSHAKLRGKDRSERMEFKIIKERFPALYDEMVRLNRSEPQLGRISWMKGKKHSHTTLQKMKENADHSTPYVVQVTRNDGVVFPSIKLAAEASGTNKPNIVAQIKGDRRVCNGFQFQYGKVSAWVVPDLVHGKSKAVIRDDGVIFDSITKAAKESNVLQGNVTKVLLGKRKTTGGYSFKYYEEREQ